MAGYQKPEDQSPFGFNNIRSVNNFIQDSIFSAKFSCNFPLLCKEDFISIKILNTLCYFLRGIKRDSIRTNILWYDFNKNFRPED